jgi:DNA-binding response OmpR family regulator
MTLVMNGIHVQEAETLPPAIQAAAAQLAEAISAHVLSEVRREMQTLVGLTHLPDAMDDFYVDQFQRHVYLDGQRLDPPLSQNQFTLLATLWDAQDRAVSRDEIVQAVWPESMQAGGITDQAIDQVVGRLRQRVGRERVETIRGYGFRLRV